MAEDESPYGLVMVDDNRLAAEAMERWLERSGELRWLGWASDRAAAHALVAERRPAVVLLDVDMPGVDSFELLRGLSGVRVVMFSGHTQTALIDRALRDGASGYIAKDEPMTVIAGLLVRAARGECVLSPAAAEAYMR
jgi:DNA-binding NarL/FixJ family response regulator